MVPNGLIFKLENIEVSNEIYLYRHVKKIIRNTNGEICTD